MKNQADADLELEVSEESLSIDEEDASESDYSESVESRLAIPASLSKRLFFSKSFLEATYKDLVLRLQTFSRHRRLQAGFWALNVCQSVDDTFTFFDQAEDTQIFDVLSKIDGVHLFESEFTAQGNAKS